MKAWSGILTVVVIVLMAGLIVGLSALNADIQRLDAQLSELKGSSGDPASLSGAPSTLPEPAPALDARIVSTSATTTTFAVTVTARFSGPADLLAEPPVLQGAKTYPVTPESLGRARFAFLDLVSKGETTAAFVFSGSPAPQESLTLVFNPSRRAADAVSPRREIKIR